jgi:general secretion pathway protein K
MRAPRRYQAGVALITAVLVVAIATLAATAMLASTQIAIHRSAALQETEKAWWYAEGVEQWVATLLQRDAEQNQVDSLDEPWARPVDYLPVDDGVLRGRVLDLQGRFNLNNLGHPDLEQYARYRDHFERLFRLVEAGDSFAATAVAAAVRDWIDADQEPTGFDGAEDSDYLVADPPYRAANQPMGSVSELLLVKGVDRDMYRALAPHLAVLPGYGTPVNVNTATEPVLLSLVEAATPELQRFLEQRETEPAQDLAVIQPLFPALSPPISISTQYFKLESEVLIGSSRVALYHFFFRPGAGAPVLLGRSTDTD